MFFEILYIFLIVLHLQYYCYSVRPFFSFFSFFFSAVLVTSFDNKMVGVQVILGEGGWLSGSH